MDNKLLYNVIIRGKIKLKTGLHIGGTSDNFEIGGMDNPVIRDAITKLPYIPGSSLKGKLRVELEWALDAVSENAPSKDKKITRIFGKSADKNDNSGEIARGKLIVRDAYPEGYEKIDIEKDLSEQDDDNLSSTLKMWRDMDSGLPYTEWKSENKINRINAGANPRSIERVPAGSIFNFELIYSCYDEKEGKEDLELIKTGFKLLEDSYLGGSGTRGYGKIEFFDVKYIKRSSKYYLGEEKEVILTL